MSNEEQEIRTSDGDDVEEDEVVNEDTITVEVEDDEVVEDADEEEDEADDTQDEETNDVEDEEEEEEEEDEDEDETNEDTEDVEDEDGDVEGEDDDDDDDDDDQTGDDDGEDEDEEGSGDEDIDDDDDDDDDDEAGVVPATGTGTRDIEFGGTPEQPQKDRAADDEKEDDKLMAIAAPCLCIWILIMFFALLYFAVWANNDDDPEPSQTNDASSPPPSAAPPLSTWVLYGGPFDADGVAELGTSATVDEGRMCSGGPLLFQGLLSCYVLDDLDQWTPISQISVDANNGARFGASVQILGGSRMIVGAPDEYAIGSETPTGAAYLLEFDEAVLGWGLSGDEIRGDEDSSAIEEGFGTSVSLSEDGRIAIGAPGSSFGGILGTGRVYSFFSQGGSTVALEQEPLVGNAAGDAFGTSVALSMDGSRLLVGAPATAAIGYAVIYEWLSETWQVQDTLNGTQSGEGFGTEVVMLSGSGDIFAVGAPEYNDGAGRVVVYGLTDNGFEVLGEGVEGGASDRVGATGTFDGYSDGSTVSLVVGTAAGMVRRYDMSISTMEWEVLYEEVQVFEATITSLSTTSGAEVFVAGSASTSEVVIYKGLAPPDNRAGDDSSEAPSAQVPGGSPTYTPKFNEWALSGGTFTAEGTDFGASVALTEAMMAVGAPGASNGDEAVGGVYTYTQSEDGWTESTVILGEQANAGFGTSLSLLGSAILIGAPFTFATGTLTSVGAAYVYAFNGEGAEQVGSTIYGSRDANGDSDIYATTEEFGSSVSHSANNILVIGAPSSDFELVYGRGRVYIYEFEDDWTLKFEFVGLTSYERFGSAVDISADGNVFIAGSPGSSNGGVATIFEFIDSDWVDTARIEATQPGEAMGTSVQVISDEGSMVAAGAPDYDNGAGRVVVYQKDIDTNEFVQVGPAIVGEPGDRLGDTNSISGNFEIAYPSIMVATASGSIKRFDYDPNAEQWVLLVIAKETNMAGLALAAAPGHLKFAVSNTDGAEVYEFAS